ncbi:unnamed protein product, partial [Trichobilharzia regenti]
MHFRGTFELEPESHCTTDFLEIRDGAFGFTTLLGRFCSKQVPDLGAGLISSGQYMWLRFRSDSTIAHRGFQAVYRFIQADSQQVQMYSEAIAIPRTKHPLFPVGTKYSEMDFFNGRQIDMTIHDPILDSFHRSLCLLITAEIAKESKLLLNEAYKKAEEEKKMKKELIAKIQAEESSAIMTKSLNTK